MGFIEELTKRILVLDGALGTMIQSLGFKEEDFRGREFLDHAYPLSGFNDLLNLTKPSAIIGIHEKYLEAGADIITTNTFNSNAISMNDYGMGKSTKLIKRINKEGALLAKEAIKKHEKENNNVGCHFVGGSVGPTNRSLSMSPDISDPLKRQISYDELKAAYIGQIEGLLEGGVDLLIFETFFDTLNLKAALDAANHVMEVKGINYPILVSATISDNAGRILSGQTIEAYLTSISHYPNLAVIGLNCGFGPDKMKEYIKEINKSNTHFTSCHPNAGLPDESGCYNISPEEFKEYMRELVNSVRLNVVGGCCGTTPQHIKELKDLVKDKNPILPAKEKQNLQLSGLERVSIKNDFLIVGERCNVAGSSKFLRLIKEGNYEEASEIAKNQIRKGAQVIDINMDDPLLDAQSEMIKFLRYVLAEPEIAKVPFMIDSSKWDVIESSLKEIQGKGIVNSLSLKEGEEKFIEKAKKVKELGFALIVMAFDEKGQADTYERKIEICKRAYRLLTEKCGFSPNDIIFDVNIMTIGTGMQEHSKYAVDFIEAVKWIKLNLPGVRTSGGVSNLSFAFRGKNKIREYMHKIFLYHAQESGLDMAIINPTQTGGYEAIPSDIKEVIEDLIFDRNSTAVEKLINFAQEETAPSKPIIGKEAENSNEPIESILRKYLVAGELKGLENQIERAMEFYKDPVKIIDGPLMEGMKQVGDLFGEGKMFLPQVVKTARTMKRAVDLLTPFIEKNRLLTGNKKTGKILIATVKGDVHDIGKNIVSTVLACNNYDVIDLGIMAEPDKIVETALREKPDIICLSGLITPSLGEMIETVKQLSKAKINVPVMVGGAATSPLHTALKISPEYEGVVLHMADASQNPLAANKILNPEIRNSYLESIEKQYSELKNLKEKKNLIVPYHEILKLVEEQNRNDFKTETPKLEIGKNLILPLPIKELIPLINWKMFFLAWKLHGKHLEKFPFEKENWKDGLTEDEIKKGKEAKELYKNALDLLLNFHHEDFFDGKAIIKFVRATGDVKNIIIEGETFPMLRQQTEGSDYLSCCDYVSSSEKSNIGLFAVTSGLKLQDKIKLYEKEGDSYSSLILQTLADRIVEAGAEWLHKKVKSEYWDVSIRPAWGYPMLPDQTLILKTEKFLNYKEIGISLTENGAMYPPSSISGLFLSKPEAKYFMVGQIGEDQLKDYAERRGMNPDEMKSILKLI